MAKVNENNVVVLLDALASTMYPDILVWQEPISRLLSLVIAFTATY